MIRKTITLLSIFGIAYGLHMFFAKNDKRPVEAEQKALTETENPYAKENSEEPNAEAMSSIHKSVSQGEGEKTSPTTATEEEKKPPLLSTLREEIKQNPHVTPQSLVEYAQQVGKRMESALTSNYSASILFDELKDCVEGQEFQGSPSLQAFCISSAERLAQAHPDDLMSKYKDMVEKVPEDSAALMQAIDDVNPTTED